MANQQPSIQSLRKIRMLKSSIDATLHQDSINQIAAQPDKVRIESKEATKHGQLKLDLRGIEAKPQHGPERAHVENRNRA
jgi:hypothetical protein